MLNLISIFFVASTLIYFFFSRNIKHFLFFGIIFFNVFSLKGYGLLDDFFLFLALISLFINEFKKKNSIQKFLSNFISELKVLLKNNYLYLAIFILLIYYLFLTLEGAIIYDLRVLRYFLFFILVLIYLFFNKKFNFDILSLKNSVFIVNTTTFVFLLYLLQGILFEISSSQKLARYLSQGNLVSGSSMAFAILIFSTIPALKIYKYKPLNSILFLIVIFSNIIFWDSRVGSLVITLFILINFLKKIYVPFLCIVAAVAINIIIEFNTYYFKYDKVLKFNENQCEKNNFGKTHSSCNFKSQYDGVLYALQRLDQRYWHVRPAFSTLSNYYKFNILDREKLTNKVEGLKLVTNTFLLLVQNSTINYLGEPSKHIITENIVIKPQLSDYDRMVPVIASIDLIINNPNFIRKIFGFGFYSHKEELVEPINKTLLSEKSFSEYNAFFNEKATFPVRTANLPAIITDGGIFLVLIYIIIFSVIGLRILKNLISLNKSNFWGITNLFLNKGLIISFIFFLNYINYNLDCIFIYMILINPNHFTEFDFDA